MLRRLLIKYGWVPAEIAFLGNDLVEVKSFLYSVKDNQYVSRESYDDDNEMCSLF
ncbi:hypothetical protein M413DRAFT_448658, partial [Hebeloma cylindrosporum]